MANESVYVAIAIACVVALLVLAILVIYCIKRQQDKMHERIIRERRLREERQRRNFMRAHIVQPPSYEASRGSHQTGIFAPREIPYSPPPEYKEVATPIPSLRHNQVVGIGGVPEQLNGHPPEYTNISSVSRNVAPVYTHLPAGMSTLPNNANNNATFTTTTRRDVMSSRSSQTRAHQQTYRESAIQVQVSPRPTRVLPDVVTSTTHSSSRRLPEQTTGRRPASRAAQGLDSSTLAEAGSSRASPAIHSFVSAQTQIPGANGNRVSTPVRFSANTQNGPASASSAEAPLTNSNNPRIKNQAQASSQFQDLALI